MALGATLRGWFKLEGLGEGKVFLQADCPPFVLVRLNEGFVLVNFPDPARTRALYDALVAATQPGFRAGGGLVEGSAAGGRDR
jgi:hypothetical protein